jgi:hypothetical protein
MRKLLIEYPNGTQELRSLENSASFQTSALLLWDELADGPFPDGDMTNLGGWVKSGNTLLVDNAKLTAYQTAKQAAETSENNKQTAMTNLKARLKTLAQQDDLTAAEVKESILKFIKFMSLRGDVG